MRHIRPLSRLALAAGLAAVLFAPAALADDLPSWTDGATKKSITDFVAAVTTEGGPDYVAPADRIATFDNDGTLWSEQPMYVQLAFALDRVKAMAADHPEWKDTEPFKSVLTNDLKGVAASGKKGLAEIIAVTHTGISTDDFAKIASDWIETAKHPKSGKAYTEMVYQPMLELIAYLKANEFDVFIVSGGGIEFMRPWTAKIYGIPPQNVVGSSVKTKYEVKDGTPVLMREAALDFVDDKDGKPVGINSHIGKRPIAAFGNSDGDFQMLQWTTAGSGKRLGLLVHHDDADREVAYDRKSHFGQLDKGLDEGPKLGWTIVSMKNDWTCVFADQCK